MTPQAIAQLRRKFIIIATLSFFVVIGFTGLMAFLTNRRSVRSQAESTIDAIIAADGEMPRLLPTDDQETHQEAVYGLRFFTVRFNEEGEVVDVDLTHVASIDREGALEVAVQAADPDTITKLSSYGTYFYKEGEVEGGTMVVFLDCAVQMAINREVGANMLFICGASLAAVFITVLLFSGRAIAPEVESARRQQQFVTNASHELKTPISVIRANTEVTEMISGETEWTSSTIRQVDRLEELVGNLMTIARGAEHADTTEVGEVDASQVVSDAVESFHSRAVQSGLKLESGIDPDVVLRGTTASLEQLTCLLVDNAIKYCDANGAILVRLAKGITGRNCTLVVSNDYAEGADVDYKRFFDRFYREDESHKNQQGYGIGLSVAESLCKRYHGNIKATWTANTISFTCTLKGM